MLPVLTHPLSSSCAGQVAMETASSSDKEAATTAAAATKTIATRPTSLSLICPLLPKHLTAGEYSILCESLLYWVNIVCRQWNMKLSSWNVNGVRAWLKVVTHCH